MGGTPYIGLSKVGELTFKVHVSVFNPRRTRRRVTVLGLCVSVSVCLSVTMLAATYLVCKSQMKCHMVLYGVFNTCIVWILLKTLRSKVLASFAVHNCHSRFLTSSPLTEETVRDSFQQG